MAIRTTLNDFLKRSKKIHGDRYDYSKVNYKGVHHRVKIICPKHGEFELRARAHYDEYRGCPDCDTSGKSGFSDKSKWIKLPKIVYIIEVTEKGEKFIKFGLTKEKILAKRFQKGEFPYNYQVLFEKRIKDGVRAKEIEDKLKLKYSKISYKASKNFRGYTECLDYVIKEHILKDVKRIMIND